MDLREEILYMAREEHLTAKEIATALVQDYDYVKSVIQDDNMM